MISRKYICISLISVLSLLLAVAYAGYRLGLRPVAATGPSIEFTVVAGENAPQVAQRLVSTKLLRSSNSFITYVNFHGLRPRLKAGQYSIAPTMSGGDIAELLAGGRTLTKRLVVPEGYRISQIEASAVAAGITKSDFRAALVAPHVQSFLAGKPADVDLEGYLFPDSYAVNSNISAANLINSMLDNFAARVGPEYAQAYAAEGLTLHQGLTLASIVEREVYSATDRPVVAQIFLKRFKDGTTLGSDVTTLYAAELLGVSFDVNIDSRYNTRRYAGLPPGPICNPGLGALDAVAHPASTNYTYFLSGKDGKTYFANTYAQHQANIAKHL